MKKLFFGILIGVALSLTTAAVAANTIQAVIFPAKFTFNGIEKTLGSDYTVLNYKDHIYVPLRFVAESMGGSVIYTPSDDPSVPNQIDTIYTASDPNDLTVNDSNNVVSVGKITILSEPDGTRSVIQGQVMLNKSDYPSNYLTFTINTYDISGKLVTSDSIGEYPIRVGQILPFSILTMPDLQKETFDHITITNVSVKEAANQ